MRESKQLMVLGSCCRIYLDPTGWPASGMRLMTSGVKSPEFALARVADIP
jgi:hypothetical protein